MKPNTSPTCTHPPQFNHVYRVSYEANIHEKLSNSMLEQIAKTLFFKKKVLKSIKFFPELH